MIQFLKNLFNNCTIRTNINWINVIFTAMLYIKIVNNSMFFIDNLEKFARLFISSSNIDFFNTDNDKCWMFLVCFC